MSALAISNQNCTGGSIKCKKEKRVKDNQHMEKKKVKQFLSTDDMILYVENSMESIHTHETKTKTKKQVQQGQKIQVQYIKIPTVFLYTINEQSKHEKKPSNCIQNRTKRIKYLGINLTKGD